MATEAGFYDPPSLMPAVPKLQILTIEGLLDPNGPKLVLPLFATDGTFKRAERQRKTRKKK